MKKRLLYIVCVLAFTSVSIVGQAVWAGQQPGRKQVLDNGLTVLIQEMASSPVVAVDMLVKTGSATEGEYLGSGISHFVEHMLFKGTKEHSVGQISKEVKALGGNINASTSYDYTIYTINVPQGHVHEALDILYDMLVQPALDPEEVAKEQDVILNEIRMRDDHPEYKLSELVFGHVFRRHPYRHRIIGYESLFKQITREDLYDYYSTRYAPNNMILSIAGAVKTNEILPVISERFKDFAPQPYRQRNLPREPQQISELVIEEEYPTDLIRLAMAYQGISISDEDLFALDVLAMALGQGKSSRLYLDVYKQKGLVDSISAWNFTPMDQGFFEINARLTEDRIDEVIEAVNENIVVVQKKGITPKELEKTKRQVLSESIFDRQTAATTAYQSAVEESMTGDYRFTEKYVQGIRQVTNEDIRRVANRYLREDRLTQVVLRPEQQGKAGDVDSQELEESPIQKTQLANGLTILLKEDHTSEIITARVMLNAGTRQEPVELNGIGELTVRTWIKGTKSRGANQISELVESRGGSLGSFGGRNSMGLTLELLSDDQDMGLDLLEDLIKSPSFPAEEIDKERQRLKTSLIAKQDSIFQVTFRAMIETLFLKHPFRLDTLGTMASLDRIDRDAVLRFYEKFCAPNNMVIAVYGDMDASSVLSQLKNRLEGLKEKQVSLVKHQELPPEEVRQKSLTMDKRQAVVLMGFQAPNITHEDRYGMDVIESILGSTLSGRLFMRIREEFGGAYSLGVQYIPIIDAGMIYFYVLTTNEHAEHTKEILLSEIEKLKTDDVPEEELTETKTYLKGRFKMGLETVSSLAFMTGLDELYGLGYDYYSGYDQRIDSVTQQQIKRLARTYLNVQQAAIVITYSQEDADTPDNNSPKRK